MDELRFRELLEAYVTEKLSAEDKALILSLHDKERYIAILEKIMQEDWETGRYEQEENLQLRNWIEQQVNNRIDETLTTIPFHRIIFFKTTWFKYAAAVLIILSASAYLWNIQQRKTPEKAQVNNHPAQDVSAPSLSRATITLSNGEQIIVDNAMDGTLAMQGNVQIEKTNDGRIVYKGVSTGKNIQYNTFSVPRGSRIASIVLADGSKVWLNAASSITYPVAFNANERRVEITGEAYFEVAKDPSRKFIVNSDRMTTEVLGTHFNVNSYKEESDTRVTLLEGSVKVVNRESINVNDESVKLKPGEQAVLIQNSSPAPRNSRVAITINHPDMETIMAWKNGVFSFEGKKLDQVMREFARWYDLKIKYDHAVPDIRLKGKIGRNLNLSQILKGLEAMEVRCRLEDGRTLIVLP